MDEYNSSHKKRMQWTHFTIRSVQTCSEALEGNDSLRDDMAGVGIHHNETNEGQIKKHYLKPAGNMLKHNTNNMEYHFYKNMPLLLAITL